ncbi:hypothetical protein PLICRDRAFT_46070 [Plicaturopsis crispa FD-325 SS-3]|uniref:Ribosomal protein S8 n=1 Tax=Plicaturopsis crispa FD-325 SS-3 TaxID=944288 RepID=A0A0C9SL11_PLICR|nr:hypothetical protein PLICRDRAFT_46070 [Plicaturopsis crispa FD-325 SS-3]
MPLPHDLCSHLQNAFRARHASVCVPHTSQNLGILSILLRAGFLSSLSRGTPAAASPEAFLQAPSPAQQRIWADLKYRDDRPVLSAMELVSMPSKKVWLDLRGIRALASGRAAGVIRPLGMGEVCVVRTRVKEHEWLEAREALQLGLDGEVICRAR